MKNKLWLFLSLALTGIGAYLLSIDSISVKIFGVILTISGGFLTYKVSNKNAANDKNQIIEKIDQFKGELEYIKLSSTDLETKDKIGEIKSEFDEWAKSFKTNLSEKQLEFQSTDIELEKTKINLSREYRDYYIKFFE